MRPSTALPRFIVILLALSATAVLAVLAVLLATEKRVAAAAPDYRVVTAGGIEYEWMLGRPVDPKNAVDKPIVAGLSAVDRTPRAGTLLFGAFISVTNDTSHALRTADRIELRDDDGRVYHPISLPSSNAYAYRAGVVRPGNRRPSFGSPADNNLAATGLMLLFRIPAWDYDDGVLELVIHDPHHPTRTVSLRV